MAKAKEKDIEGVVKDIEKEHGDGVIMRFGDEGSIKPFDVISTGSILIDEALGIGGVPRGRITEIFADESVGKTTLALHIIAEAQKAGGTAVFIDAEHAVDMNYAKNLGVDTDNLLLSQPDYGEQALNIAEALIKSKKVDIVVIDSVSALVPKKELDGETGDQHVGLQARMLSQALRRISGQVNKSQTSLVFINQTREKVGVSWGNPMTTSGGKALKFYASVRIHMQRIGSVKVGTDFIGNKTRAKIVKNKCASPFKEAEFSIIWGKGIYSPYEIADLAVDEGLIEQKGAWYIVNEDEKFQGKTELVKAFEENEELYNSIKGQILEARK